MARDWQHVRVQVYNGGDARLARTRTRQAALPNFAIIQF
jgi:hypothetical protein